MPKKNILISNDDGIDSYFLKALVDSHSSKFNVSVVAPSEEQSWSGRSFSRTKSIKCKEYDKLGCPAWSISGTPSDCVNLALGELLDDKPDIVISGINIGFNCGIPYILASGTVAAALEATLWGIPSLAFSQMLPDELFEEVRLNKGFCTGPLADSIRCAAEHAEKLTEQRLHEFDKDEIRVHNVNFPKYTTMDTIIEKTIPGECYTRSLFKRENETGFCFNFMKPEKRNHTENSDYACLLRGNISYSILNYSLK
jgi:5'-nucleotidase